MRKLIDAELLEEKLNDLPWYSVRDGFLQAGATAETALYKFEDVDRMICDAPEVPYTDALNGWIAAGQRKPDEGEPVVTFRAGIMSVEFLRGTVWSDDWRSAAPVSHWMPLPEPPKGGTEHE